jgi:hypothetical protein
MSPYERFEVSRYTSTPCFAISSSKLAIRSSVADVSFADFHLLACASILLLRQIVSLALVEWFWRFFGLGTSTTFAW